MSDAFATADDVLRQAIQGISDLILVPGLINLDFADVKTIMSRHGHRDHGHRHRRRARTARWTRPTAAISSPLLEDASVQGARGVIINVTGGPDLTLAEVSEASDDHPGSARTKTPTSSSARSSIPKMEGQGQDHRHRHRLRSRAGDRVRRTARRPTTPVDLQPYTRAAGDRDARRSPVGGGGSRLIVTPAPGARPAGRRRRVGSVDDDVGPATDSSRCRRSTCRRSCAGRTSSRPGCPRRRGPSPRGWPPQAHSRARSMRRRGGAEYTKHDPRHRGDRRRRSIGVTAHGAPSRNSARPQRSRPRNGSGPRARARRPGARSRLRHASPTAAGCASRSRSRTPTSSGCRTSGSRPSTSCSTPTTTWCASACSCRGKQELQAQLASRRSRCVTLESQTPGRDFDVFAFSVSFEWDYTNVLTMLRLAGLAAAAPSARTRRDPLVVIGGAVTFVNPEPLAPVRRRHRRRRRRSCWCPLSSTPSRTRAADRGRRCCDRLAAERGFYIPSLLRRAPTTATARVAAITPKPGTGAPPVVHKAAVKATDRLDPPARRSSRPTPSSARAS